MGALAIGIRLASVALLAGAVRALGGGRASAEIPKAFECSFAEGYFTVVEEDHFKSEGSGDTDFVLAAINLSAGTAQMVGTSGAAEVSVLAGRYSLQFVELMPVGNLTVTTVYKMAGIDFATKFGLSEPSPTGGVPGFYASADRFVAVHSRHVGHSADPMLSQLYGFCEAKW